MGPWIRFAEGLGLPNETLDVGNRLRGQLQVRVSRSRVSRDVLHYLVFGFSGYCKTAVLTSISTFE